MAKNWKNKYAGVGGFKEGRAWVFLNNKYGHVNLDGKVTTPIIYDYVGPFSEGRAEVDLNNKWGHVDLEGKVIEGKYDLIIGCFEK